MRKAIPGLIVGLTLIFTAIAYPALPERIVTHWGIGGQPDGWSSRTIGAWLLPLIMLAIWGLMRVLPKIDPKGANYARFESTYFTLINVIVAFMAVLQIAILGTALQWPISMPNLLPFLMGLLFVVVGNLLPRTRPNWFIGIRVPWTLSSDRVWERTHRLGGLLFVISGLLLLATSFAPEAFLAPAIAVTVVIAAVVPIIYSLVLWTREKRQT